MPVPLEIPPPRKLLRRHAALAPWLSLLILGAGPAAARVEQPAAPPPAPPPAAPPTTAPDRGAAAQEALGRATEALSHDDLQGALRAATEAVALDPKSYQIRMQRVAILFRVRGAGKTAADNQRIEDTLRADLRAAIAAAPGSTAAGVARDALAKLDRGAPIAAPLASCTPAATAEFDEAERLFGSKRLEESLAHYERAAAQCPENPAIWTSYGDAFFMLGDLPKARHNFETALAKSPWHAQAHRFLADTLGRQRQVEAAYHECVLAVVSDPTYDAAWGYLASIIQARKGTWGRVVAVKPTITRDAAGKVEVGMSPQALDPGWMAYTLTRSTSSLRPAGAGPAPSAAPTAPTALAAEREAVRAALTVRAERRADAAPFWDMMARADQAGFLDEAIFLDLPDAELLAEYPAYRAAHGDRLVRYVETVLAPLPPAP